VALSTLGLGKPVIEPLFDSRHPGDVLLDLGRRLAGTAGKELPWSTYQDYLKHRLEGLVVSGEGSIVTGSFEESWVHFLEARGWRFLEHRTIEDFWAELEQEAGWWNPVLTRGDWGRLFQTPSGRFEFFSQNLQDQFGESEDDASFLPHFEPLEKVGDGDLTLIPFRPITARGGLSSVSPMVLEMFGYPFLDGWQTWAELAPETAHDQNLGDGDIVAVESDRGSVEAVVRVQPGTTMGTVHMPVGLGYQEGFGAGGGVGANPIELVLPARDSLSGNLSRASTQVRLRLLRRRPHGGPPPMDGGHGA
jgi:anaerobic selenocysteine-containing dehydrogenase